MVDNGDEDRILTTSGLIIGIVAFVYRILESGDVPAVLEISVPRVASRIAGVSSEFSIFPENVQRILPSCVHKGPLVSSGCPPRLELGDIPSYLPKGGKT